MLLLLLLSSFSVPTLFTLGFLAVTEEEYAKCLEQALVTKNEQPLSHTDMQRRARLSAQRFSDEAFGEQFAACLVPLLPDMA